MALGAKFRITAGPMSVLPQEMKAKESINSLLTLQKLTLAG
jgi:hypothetical protein